MKTAMQQLLEVLERNAKNIQPIDIDDIARMIELDYIPLEKKQQEENEDKNVHPLVMFGWTCPRCATVHSPYSAQCFCPAPSYTTTGSTHFAVIPCNHKWVRTTKNYKSIRKCVECGEIKQNSQLNK